MVFARLITLSNERIAAELRAVKQAEAAAREARRQNVLLGVEVASCYLAGLFLMGLAFHSTDPAQGQYLAVLGLVIAAVGPIVLGYMGWRSQAHDLVV